MSTESRVQQAAHWSLRRDEGMADAQAFEDWLCDPANREVYEELTGALEAVESFAGAPEMVQLRGRALVLARRSHDVLRAKAFFTSKLGLAASAAFLAITAATAFVWLRAESHIIATAVGERRMFALADGSRLSLDAASRVDVHFSSERRRLVLERGRARFDVAKDALRPFTVEVAGKTVVAVGTSFSVELVNREVHVVLYDGRVEVLPARLALTPGHELIAPAKERRVNTRVVRVDPARASSWENGELAFAEESLASAVEQMNRYSGDKLEVADAAAGQVRISGVFHASDTEAFIDGVSSIFPVRVEREGSRARFVFEDQKRR